MNDPEEARWRNLVALSAPAFGGAPQVPPYGFTTRFLARMAADSYQCQLMERIGMRALFASLAILVMTLAFMAGVRYTHQSDLEPGVKGMLQVANMPVS